MACIFYCLIEMERLLTVAGSHVHGTCGNMSETIRLSVFVELRFVTVGRTDGRTHDDSVLSTKILSDMCAFILHIYDTVVTT